MSTAQATNRFTLAPAALIALLEIDLQVSTDIEADSLQELLDKGLVEERTSQPRCWVNNSVSLGLTRKGSVFIYTLYDLPLPVQVNDGCWEIPKGQS